MPYYNKDPKRDPPSPPPPPELNSIKLETGLRPNSAGRPYTLLLRIEAMRFPTLGLLLYSDNRLLVAMLSLCAYMGVSENGGDLIWGVLITRILLFRVPYQGPLFSETPTFLEHEITEEANSYSIECTRQKDKPISSERTHTHTQHIPCHNLSHPANNIYHSVPCHTMAYISITYHARPDQTRPYNTHRQTDCH